MLSGLGSFVVDCHVWSASGGSVFAGVAKKQSMYVESSNCLEAWGRVVLWGSTGDRWLELFVWVLFDFRVTL